MKPYSFCFALAVGISIWGCDRSAAQPLLLSAPISIQVAGIDPCRVMNPHVRLMNGKVGFVFKDMHQPEVEALVRYGVFSYCPVCVMDGHKLVALGHLVGEMRFGEGVATEYGFVMSFGSIGEVDRVALVMRRGASPKPKKQELEELIRSHERDLDDQRFWRAQTRSNTALEPTATAP